MRYVGASLRLTVKHARSYMRHMDAHETRLLTVEEVAELIQYHPQSVRAFAKIGALPCVRIKRPGAARGKLRFRRADVDAWIARQHQDAAKA